MTTRELRLALAMRGGVSLAVWIGGACAEITALRDRPADDDFWGPLLEAAGYDSVRIDVLAGASAGGLNGTLLAASLLYGVPFDRYRDLWLEVADLRALLRDPAERAPRSVLRGDEYFLAQLEQQLGALVAAEPANASGAEHLDLHLTATLLAPTAVPVLDDWADSYAEGSHRAGFRFRHSRFTSDFRRGGDPIRERAGVVAKLALAARATSSFPGAFEPATVSVARPPHVGERAALTDRGNLFGLFSDASRPVHRVIDGGVLDNIPVSQALEAIATSSARGPTERWLLYLHPSPEDPPDAAPDAGTDTVRTVLAASSVRANAESVLDDLALLRAHNLLVDRYRAVRRALLADAPDADGTRLVQLAAARARDYWTLRTERAARRVRRLLEDPVDVLGEDPFTSDAERWPLGTHDGWPVRDRAGLEQAVLAALRRGTAGQTAGLPAGQEEVAALGVEPAARLAHVLHETLWRLERTATEAGRLAAVKARLYAVADTADLLAHMGDLFWPALAAREPPARGTLGAWARTAVAAHARFVTDPGANPVDAPDLLEPFAVLRAELRRRSAVLPAVASPLPDVLWAELAGCVVELARLGAGTEPETDADAGLPPALLAHVRGGGPTGARPPVGADPPAGAVPPAEAASRAALDRAAQALAALEVLAYPLQTLATKPPQTIRFLRIAGSRRSPLERHFPGGALTVGDKLAGNELMNFAAFYKQSWRANDWMWGRLDAAATLVDLLVRPAALRRAAAGPWAPGADPGDGDRDPAAGDPDPAVSDRAAHARAAALVTHVRAHVRRPVAASPPLDAAEQQAWEAHLAGLWETHAAAVTAEAEALFADVEGADLAATRELLVTRRQYELLLDELPVVLRAVEADGGRRRAGDLAGRSPRTPEQLLAALGHYGVGRETITEEVGTPRFVRLAGDLAVVGWNAVTGGLGRAARPLRPLGWLLRLVRRASRLAVAAPRWARAPARLLRRLARR